MGALSKSIQSARAVAKAAWETTRVIKAGGSSVANMITPGFSNTFGQWSDQAKYNERYNLFRHWVYAAINAISSEAAGQPVCVGRIISGKRGNGDLNTRKGETLNSMLAKSTMPTAARIKAADEELEVLKNHPLALVLEQPNPVQGRSEFVYSFVANLCLTGWAFVVLDQDDEGNPEYYSLPTTWIRPDHTEGPFSRFRVVDPRNPTAAAEQSDWLTRDQVGFAHLPNPADPMSALAPAASQMGAIRINDHIETSRERFFNNGIFPSVVVTVGKDPHPDVPGGMRPRLTNEQRRQIYSVIQKTMGGVANYGVPAIVDGLIESISRFSMTDPEMGWEKSEASVKASILSAFCVHPYLLAEQMAIGGYAQTANIEKRFYKKVNAYLDMLGRVITALVARNNKEGKGVIVWWEKCVAEDPTRTDAMLRFARQNNDISQNEFRAKIGFPPDEDRTEQRLKPGDVSMIVSMLSQIAMGAVTPDQAIVLLREMGVPESVGKEIAKSKDKPKLDKAKNVLLSGASGLNGAIALLSSMGQGILSVDTTAKLFALFFDIPEEEAKTIIESSKPPEQPAAIGIPGVPGAAPGGEISQTGGTPEEAGEPTEPTPEGPAVPNPFEEMGLGVAEATRTLEKALKSLLMTPDQIADEILKQVQGNAYEG